MPELTNPILPGDRLKAGPIEAIRRVASRLKLSVLYPLELRRGPGGWALGYRGPEEFWAKTTSSGASGGKYGWLEQVPLAGGSWQNGHRSGTTSVLPAIEINANTSIATGTYIWIRRDSTELSYRFIFSSCS